MKATLLYLAAGIYFGFVLVRAEVVSWFRIIEMFRFEAFHMYGVILSAIVVGIICLQVIKKLGLTDLEGKKLALDPKSIDLWKSYLLGGIIFGLGWGLTGACPGPLFTLVGAGYTIMLVPIASAVAGVWVYGKFKEKMIH
ncbi:MAG: YeeE/YedE family protein [Flavobacteriales bacterium]|nr:YeeE/YedE family protein [Bacteroidota bacterium]NCQ15183.1 YeeE/YedE family protein [Flavobacteriales bacterium]